MNEKNYSGKQLAELLASELPQAGFDIRSIWELLHFTYGGEDFYCLLRAVSYAGNPHPLHKYRAQMPRRPYLENYKDNGGVFLFIGYDSIHNIYVIWNPYTLRPRINQKEIVSLFCDLDILENAQETGLCWGQLSNGGLYVAFTIERIREVLDNLSYFKTDVVSSPEDDVANNVTRFIIQKIREGYSTLDIVENCMNLFSKLYPDFDYLTWRNIIKSQKAALEQEADEETSESVEEVSQENVPEEHDIAYYEKRIYEMATRTTDNKAKVCKLLLLLSTFEYIPKCPSTRDIKNRIPLLAAWEGQFLNNVSKYVGKLGRESTLFSSPFFLLEEEPFWRLIPIEDDYQKTGYNIKTFANLQDIYSGVEIDEELVELIRQASYREELMNYVLSLIPSNMLRK